MKQHGLKVPLTAGSEDKQSPSKVLKLKIANSNEFIGTVSGNSKMTDIFSSKVHTSGVIKSDALKSSKNSSKMSLNTKNKGKDVIDRLVTRRPSSKNGKEQLNKGSDSKKSLKHQEDSSFKYDSLRELVKKKTLTNLKVFDNH